MVVEFHGLECRRECIHKVRHCGEGSATRRADAVLRRLGSRDHWATLRMLIWDQARPERSNLVLGRFGFTDLKGFVSRECDKEVRFKLSKQVCAAVDALHCRHFVHCDLKLQNILVHERQRVRVSGAFERWCAGIRQLTHLSPGLRLPCCSCRSRCSQL